MKRSKKNINKKIKIIKIIVLILSIILVGELIYMEHYPINKIKIIHIILL